MPRMYCQSCGKDMGNHNHHDKGTCKECRGKLSTGYFSTIERLVRQNLEVDEDSRTWR